MLHIAFTQAVWNRLLFDNVVEGVRTAKPAEWKNPPFAGGEAPSKTRRKVKGRRRKAFQKRRPASKNRREKYNKILWEFASLFRRNYQNSVFPVFGSHLGSLKA